MATARYLDAAETKIELVLDDNRVMTGPAERMLEECQKLGVTPAAYAPTVDRAATGETLQRLQGMDLLKQIDSRLPAALRLCGILKF